MSMGLPQITQSQHIASNLPFLKNHQLHNRMHKFHPPSGSLNYILQKINIVHQSNLRKNSVLANHYHQSVLKGIQSETRVQRVYYHLTIMS